MNKEQNEQVELDNFYWYSKHMTEAADAAGLLHNAIQGMRTNSYMVESYAKEISEWDAKMTCGAEKRDEAYLDLKDRKTDYERKWKKCRAEIGVFKKHYVSKKKTLDHLGAEILKHIESLGDIDCE